MSDDSVRKDLRELLADHPASAVLFALFVLAIVAADILFVTSIGTKLNNLQSNICDVVATQSRGNTAQHQYWTAAAGRAHARALQETGTLRAADEDAEANDLRIAKVYAPSSYTFPGC